MKIFVTGASGFIGARVVDQLLSAGHSVIGLARSQSAAAAIETSGATAHKGDLVDLDSLRRGAEQADAVIHLGFIHDFSNFKENCEIDGQAIAAFGEVLAGSSRPLLVTAGLAGIAEKRQCATEAMPLRADFNSPRISEQCALALHAEKDINTRVIRLPQVHDRRKQGFVSFLIDLARQKKVCAYIGAGDNRWPAAHVDDVAKLYLLALEAGQSGGVYHAVAESGISMKDIASALAARLQLPLRSIAPNEAEEHFAWLTGFAGLDMFASSEFTRARLAWKPVGPGMLEDLNKLES